MVKSNGSSNNNGFLIIIIIAVILLVIIGGVIYYFKSSGSLDPTPPSSPSPPPSPLPPSKDYDLDLDAAILEIAIINGDSQFPNILNEYELDFNKDIGIYTNWSTDTDILKLLCLDMINAFEYAINNPTDENAYLAIQIGDNFVERLWVKLQTLDTRVWTSPTNPTASWRVFGIYVTRMLALYLLAPYCMHSKRAAEAILRIVNNPKTALNVERTGFDTVYLTGPFILAKYNTNVTELNDIRKSSEYNYVKNLISSTVRIAGRPGIHMDYGIFDSGNVPACDRLPMVIQFVGYYFKLDLALNINTPISDIWQKVKLIMLHSQVGFSNLGAYGIKSDYQMLQDSNSVYGFRVIPSMRYLRYFTQYTQFSIRYQDRDIAFYESDHLRNTQAQYWVQGRRIFTNISSPDLNYPEFGLCYPSTNNEKFALPPNAASERKAFISPNSSSFVMTYAEIGVAFQKYNIDEFGDVDFTERIIINANAATINILFQIHNKSNVEYTFNGVVNGVLDDVKLQSLPILPSETVTFEYVVNCQYFTTTFKRLIRYGTIDLPIVINTTNTTKIELVSPYVILYQNDDPKIAALYMTNEELEEIIVGSMKFRFNSTANQYTFVGNTT